MTAERRNIHSKHYKKANNLVKILKETFNLEDLYTECKPILAQH
jgi:hypothetical protein